MVWKLIKNLMVGSKWEIIYSTQNLEKYARVKGQLLNNGVKIKTEFISAGGGYGGGYGFGSTYHVLVSPEDVNKAAQFINQIKH